MIKESDSTVSIALICDAGYVIPTAVTISSIIANRSQNSSYEIFIVTSGISESDISEFQKFETTGVRIEVITTNLGDLETLHTKDESAVCVATPAALLKFRLPDLIPRDKLLYLDGDIVVNSDLSSLFDYDIDGYYLAAVPDSGSLYFKHKYLELVDTYFNTGVMLLNLERMRIDNCADTLIRTKAEIHDSMLMDQNVFNLVFKSGVLYLPIRFNLLYVNLHRSRKNYTIDDINLLYHTTYTDLDEIRSDAVIIHYSSRSKPWTFGNVPAGDLWYSYFIKMRKVAFRTRYSFKHVSRDSQTGVSVILPVCNAEHYLDETLASIRNQSYEDIEIICVDAGSTDGSAEILHEAQEADHRIVVIPHSNQDLNAARNVGLACASGTYVYFCDTDNLLMADALEIGYSTMVESWLQLCFFSGGSQPNDEPSTQGDPQHKKQHAKWAQYPGIHDGYELYRWMEEHNTFLPEPSLQMIGRDLLIKYDLWFRERRAQVDEVFCFEALLRAGRAATIPDVLVQRRAQKVSHETTSDSSLAFHDSFTSVVAMLSLIGAVEPREPLPKGSKDRISRLFNSAFVSYRELPPGKRKIPFFESPAESALADLLYRQIQSRTVAFEELQQARQDHVEVS
ncbi:MAG: glycosyltransferase [Propionibacteriaceae bacterium]|nr:glycosyltransferase [Propionibacteriaceae bacterium]